MPEKPGGVQQPSLERPKRDDPLRWATLSRTQTDWFRFVAPQLGLDATKLILGKVINSIIGDDVNCYFMTHSTIKDPASINIFKAHAEERLKWEVETPETPDSLKERLRLAQAIISSANWQDAESFDQANKAHETLRADVNALLEADPLLQEASEYALDLEIQRRWGPYWRQFLDDN